MKNIEYISSEQLAVKLIVSVYKRLRYIEQKRVLDITKEEWKEWKRLKELQRNFDKN